MKLRHVFTYDYPRFMIDGQDKDYITKLQKQVFDVGRGFRANKHFTEISIIITPDIDIDKLFHQIAGENNDCSARYSYGYGTANLEISKWAKTYSRRTLKTAIRYIHKHIKPFVPKGTVCFIDNRYTWNTKDAKVGYSVMVTI